MEYSKALRLILREVDMSQADLARRMGTSTAYVSQLCSGKIKEPSLTHAYDIADAYSARPYDGGWQFSNC